MQSYSVNADAWTIVGDNVTSITFQNAGQWGVYIGFNSSNTVPSETIGILYGPGDGELKVSLSDLTYVSSPTHVFARAVSKSSTVFAEGS